MTRTRDRPLLLARTAASVAAQTFQDLVWVVVVDGGDVAAARRVVEAGPVPAARRQLLVNEASQGMEAAANRGARAVASELIVIHDDDDSWSPQFLARTVGFLRAHEGRHYGGVVTHADYVSEAMAGDRIVVHDRRPYNAGLGSVPLAEMLVRNLFPPISFLFRREVYERAGGFNERLAVLGDWYFNIRFLLEADIAVLPERLAHWHHRDRGADGAYANSVIGGAAAHAAHNALVRNALVRDLPGKGGAALAPLLGAMLEEARVEQARMRRSLGSGTAAVVELTDGAADPAMRLAAAIDIADRRWVLAQLPMRARLRLGGASDPSWAALMPLIRTARLQAPADFDEAAYRAANGDVARAITAGTTASGYEHYVRYGRLEGRPRPTRV